MILRRVVEHVGKQEWTAIWIDLVLVVVGVVIGIQVSNWNEARATSRRAAVFTEQLTADLREEAWSSQLLLEYNRDVLANAERAADALSGQSTLPDEALLVSAYRATQYKQKLRRRSTYDELASTGTIGLIRNRNLRDTAMRVYTVPTYDNIAKEGRESLYRQAFRMSMPIAVQRALARHCGDRYVAIGDYAGLAGSLDYPCTTGLPEATITAAARTLRSDSTLVPLLRLRIADIETRLVDFTVNNKDIMDGLQAIAAGKP